MRFGEVRQHGNDLPQEQNRSIQIAQLRRRGAEAVPRLEHVGAEPKRVLIFRRGCLEAVQSFEGERVMKMCGRVVGVEAHGRFEFEQRRGKVACVAGRDAQRIASTRFG